MNEIARELRAAQSGLLTSSQALGRLAGLLTRQGDPGPPDPEPPRSWTLEHTPTDAVPARRLIIDPMTIEAVEAVRITLRVTLAKPLPPTGGELVYLAEYNTATKKMLFNRTISIVRHNGPGIRGVAGAIGEDNGKKTRVDIPGRLRQNQETTIIVTVRLGETMMITHGEITRPFDLTGEKAITRPWAIQLGGENPLIGSPHWVEVDLL